MKQTIATDIPQAKRLLACGVDPKTADMCWTEYQPKLYSVLKVGKPLLEEDIPAWSTSRLLSLLPNKILVDDAWFECQICKCAFGYEVRYHSEVFKDPFGCLCKNPIEGCVQAIEWLTKEGYKLNEIEE